ncbi:uncharacterized protein BP5553_02553 [Venustampulla echinocandica]|uniref:ACB domain-containing protein n=1 Tax=Venustampulla echinocandica TaxID=2656787 RepID=A0A370TRT0_9HELO|nr:uncharacterized protein BP5553_02553 [Venustampulla echinocandica]RDL38213.1 hypothetical protein BP5553_02553 [Venustampulla echinocandica]
MADSVDRVFVHALNTVKKIPKTGASRPPPSDRLRLYGLYKQAMEGDVDGVMERPLSVGSSEEGPRGEELKRERDKYDAWDSQRGLSRTEAKRRYIEALIETMHRYASTTADARELVAELEFVWDQIKNNSASSPDSSPRREPPAYSAQPRSFQQPRSGTDGAMRVLSPMSEDDEAERHSERRIGYNGEHGDNDDFNDGEDNDQTPKKWRKTVEQALVKMTAEIAALREQITTGREYQGRRQRSLGRWFAWLLWLVVRHFFVDVVVLGIVLLWMRKRKDRRVEDLDTTTKNPALGELTSESRHASQLTFAVPEQVSLREILVEPPTDINHLDHDTIGVSERNTKYDIRCRYHRRNEARSRSLHGNPSNVPRYECALFNQTTYGELRGRRLEIVTLAVVLFKIAVGVLRAAEKET